MGKLLPVPSSSSCFSFFHSFSSRQFTRRDLIARRFRSPPTSSSWITVSHVVILSKRSKLHCHVRIVLHFDYFAYGSRFSFFLQVAFTDELFCRQCNPSRVVSLLLARPRCTGKEIIHQPRLMGTDWRYKWMSKELNVSVNGQFSFSYVGYSRSMLRILFTIVIFCACTLIYFFVLQTIKRTECLGWWEICNFYFCTSN